ncbi:MAG: DedA family protein [Neisseria sp.]|nr:DedA family protein [Neisseria sp.]
MFTLLETFFVNYGYVAVFVVLIACGMGVPIPEDITLVTGGVIAGLGHANVHVMLVVGMAGVLIGDGLMFAAGRVFGHRILRFRPVARIMTPKRYAQVQEKFDKYGNWVLFVARFLPGLRTPIYISAGISRKISYFRFWLMDGLAASLSVPIWIYMGSYGAENIDWLMEKVRQFQTGVVVLMAIGAGLIVFFWYRRRIRIRFFRDNRLRIRQKLAEMKKRQKANQDKTQHDQ